MPLVRFTLSIEQDVTCPPRNVRGDSLRDVFEAYFQNNPKAREYVLDDHGALQPHMAVFIDTQPIHDRSRLTDAVPPFATIDVTQSLSAK